MIYIASPYSHPDPSIRSWRYHKALEYTAKLIRLGKPAFSPIVYGHQFVPYGAATDHIPWRSFNMTMLAHSPVVHILCLPGWLDSIGIADELAFARKLNHTIEEIPYG